jgi:outer membrane receptor protein involved in Fe transport
LRLPQVPLHQGYLGLGFDGALAVLAGVRLVGEQFDDDRNALPLRGYALFDFTVRREVSRRLDVFLSVENVFDKDYPVGRTPVETLGTPRLVHGGVRVRWAR